MQDSADRKRSNSGQSSSCPNPNFPLPLQNEHHNNSSPDHQKLIIQFNPSSPDDGVLEEMLSTITSCSSWLPPHLSNAATPETKSSDLTFFDDDNLSQPHSDYPILSPIVQQRMLLPTREFAGIQDSNLPSLPYNLGELSYDSQIRFKDDFAFNSVDAASLQSQYNGFPDAQSQIQHLHHSQSKDFRVHAIAPNQLPTKGMAAGRQAQAKQKVRARRGQATDPHSIAERLRRERIAERMKDLQELVPNANKADKASILDEIISYVRFIQHQLQVLSKGRLGHVATTPLHADFSWEGDVSGDAHKEERPNASSQRVAKLMESNMGSAMQYLKGKGICLIPLPLAGAITTNGADAPSSSTPSISTVQR